MGTYDVAVIGGGVIGQAIAWRAAESGPSVAVVDPEPGRGASWGAAGMLAPVAEAAYREEPLLRANLASHARWPAFAAALEDASGVDIGYRECGTVIVARDRDETAELDRLYAFRRELDLGVERLRGREVRRLEPALATGVRAGLHLPDDHQVDNRSVVAALRAAAERAGVAFIRARAAAVRSVGRQVAGVRLEDGSDLSAEVVVLAAGVGSESIAGLPEGWRLPVRPVKGQLLHLRVPDGQPPLTERTVRGFGIYLVSRADGRAVVGATMEERGYDRRVTVGGVYELLRDAYELVPGITECELTETTAGWRPGTPDNAPIVGRAGLDGLIAATGHFRHGMLLTPLTAEGVMQLIEGEEPPAELDPFGPDRFAGAGAEVPA